MASKRVEDYAFKHNLSFRQAKRRLGRGAQHDGLVIEHIVRGGPITGTGKKGKAAKK